MRNSAYQYATTIMWCFPAKTKRGRFQETMPTEKDDNKIVLDVIVEGVEAKVEINENAPLQTLIPKALKETGNQGRQPDDWQLKLDGNVLDLNRKTKEYNFGPGTKLFLSLRAGALG
jgi:hypothetical protein